MTDVTHSEFPTLCQKCADKVQTVDTLTSLLKVHVLEIRTLLANMQTNKNSEVVSAEIVNKQTTSKCTKINYPK